MLRSLLLSALSLAGAAVAGPLASRQANSLCDAQCMAVYQASYEAEVASWAQPDPASDPFYSTPAKASGAQPGDLLRWETIPWQTMLTNWTKIPGGMTLSRFMYMSEDLNRDPIPATGFVLLPYSPVTAENPTASQFRTLAWAHGTSGHNRQCGPLNSQNLNYGWNGPLWLVSAGYAVIATDYAGLGSDIPGGFQYEAGVLHAADVAYSVIAARKMIGHLLTNEWAVIGHSEGGMSAWRTNERLAMPNQERLLAAGKFLGAVAGAPALRPAELIPRSFVDAGDGPFAGNTNSLYVLQSVAKLYPETFQLDKILTPGALELIPLLDKSCLFSGSDLFANFTVDQVYADRSWVNSKTFAETWQQNVNGAGPHKLASPMLVVQGLNDTLTYPENCIQDFERTCSAFPESSAELVLIPGLDHGPSFFGGHPYITSWLERLFAGNGKCPKGCKKTQFQPVDPNFARSPGGY